MNVDKKIVALVILVLVSYTFLLKPQLTKRNKVMGELKTREQILTDCFSAKKKLPTESTVNKLSEGNNKLKKDYQSTARKIFHRTISEDTLPFEKEKWPLYFRKTLHVTTAELIAEAGKRNARIPSSLGFANNIPSEDDVIPLLNKLGLMREFILTALDSGVTEISGLKLLQEDSRPGRQVSKKSEEEQSLEKPGQGPKGKRHSGYTINVDTGFIKECPFVVKLSCDTEALFKLLYAFQRDYSFFLIQNIQVGKNENRLTVDLLLSALYEKKSIEEDIKPQRKKDSPPVL